MSFKHHINNHFNGCVCLANTRDEGRNRPVQLFALPGEFNYVGVSDGTDAWIAPVIADPFSVNIKRLLDDHAKGTLPRPRKKPPDSILGESAPQQDPNNTPKRTRHVLPASF